MEWRDVLNFPNYEVSEAGDIRNKETGKILKPFVKPTGKKMYRLRRDGYYYTMYEDNIVAEAFLADVLAVSKYNRVIHLDNDTTNNHYMNLAFYRGVGRRRTR